MIQVIDRTNARDQGWLLRSFSALRYDVFVRRMGWQLPCREPGFEEDQFDDGLATYLIATQPPNAVVGGARLLDTSHCSLLAEIFPELVDGAPPADEKIFEVTRFVVAPQYQRGEVTHNVSMELLWALQAYGIWAGLTHLVSVSYLSLVPIFRRAGYRFRQLGSAKEIDGSPVAAFLHEIDRSILDHSERRVGLPCELSFSARGAHGHASAATCVKYLPHANNGMSQAHSSASA